MTPVLRRGIFWATLALAVAGALVASTCNGGVPPRRTSSGGGPGTGPDGGLPVLTIGGARIRVEVAATVDERADGLMHRTPDSLPWDQGMLFIYPEDRFLSFWMRNTEIPLSIAFIRNNGRICEIHDMAPFDETSTESSEPGRYALEVHQGWFDQSGVRVGDRVKGLSSLPEAKE
jgi:uncharacterized membrane protein (UPF0127 family)